MRSRQKILTLAAASSLLAFGIAGSRTGSLEAQGAVAIQVDVAANRRPIDPRVYGVNWASSAQLAALNAPIHRWGGNAATRHNWKANADNRGSDWYFESIPGSGAAGAAFDDFVNLSRANGAQPMVTIPLIGWVGKNGPNGTKLASFSAAKYGAQQDCDFQWFPDACNGVRTNGQRITGNDPNDASVLVNPQYQKEWAQHLVTRWGAAAAGGVRYYIYDNEPSIWHETHRDVHPEGQRMAELRDLMIAYGTAIRQADPGAVFVGPEEWGWSGYFLSGYDLKYGNDTGCWSCAPDSTANGGADHVPWLLSQMRQHQQSTGNKLLHVFTLHYYPQSGEFGNDTSSFMQALRNRSTRSLWDPNYTDESWIGDRVRLIPRMKEWVSANYPGLEIGITEYNWGAENHINGATTQADILGIFGREGLNIGTFWTTPAASSPTFKAFQMYRNYDGARSAFGDVSVRATGPNPDNLAVFAAERSSDGALTVMAINKVTSSALVNLSLANFSPGTAAQVWRLSSTNAIQRQADAAVSGGAISATLPAQSITLFVVPRSGGGGGGGTPALSIGDVSVAEGSSGSTGVSFVVSLSQAPASTVTVNYATANGTATAGSDYTAASGTLSFAAGQTSKAVIVPVLGDTTIEANETFNVNLSGASGATIADAQAVGTIRNDDSPTLSIADVTVVEGQSGTTKATFQVRLSTAAAATVSVTYTTGNGTAVAPGDYAALTGNLTFSAGQTLRTVTISIVGDTAVEANETVLVNLSGATGATIGDNQGIATILNDDGATPTVKPVTWTAATGVTVSANSLTKTATTGWGNAGAISVQQIAADGFVEVTAALNSTYRMFGLSNGNSNNNYPDIDFAICICGSEIRVYEAGTFKGSFAGLATGDRLRVSATGGTVRYIRNGATFYTSTKAVVRPLLVDAALSTNGTTLTNALIMGAP